MRVNSASSRTTIIIQPIVATGTPGAIAIPTFLIRKHRSRTMRRTMINVMVHGAAGI
jgi:hypothetical protein